MKEEKFQNTEKPSHWQVCGEFWNLRGQHNWERKKKKQNPQNRCLTAAPSGEVAQIREAQAALLRVRTRPECPEDNLRELT